MFCHIIMIILYLSACASGDSTDALRRKVEELKEKSRELYGEVSKNATKSWEFENDDGPGYPNGDVEKLLEFSYLWSSYYQCCLRLVTTVTTVATEGRLPSVSLTVYVGATAFLACDLCVSPEERTLLAWWYTKSLRDPRFEPMEQKETTVEEEGDLTVYRVEMEDAGAYQCRIGDSDGGLVLLEVVDGDEQYTIETETSTENDTIIIDEDTLNILRVFPGGLSCRSRYIPKYLRNHREVRDRKSEIMIGLCKVECIVDAVFEVRTSAGRLVESANNTAGLYSLLQRLPAQPPPPVRDIVFAVRRGRLDIACPGTTLRDVPFSWMIGTLEVVPQDLLRSSGGRMYVSARDRLVITAVGYKDTNLYSCWQEGRLAGSVKVEVWEGGRSHWSRHLTLTAMLLMVGVTLRVCVGVLQNKRRKIGLL